jgi:hypothetical protein
MHALVIFLAQGFFIFLLGLQQLNVVNHNYPGAFLVSLTLGVVGFSLTAAIAEVRHAGTFKPVWWGYVLGGPIGICISMAIYPTLHAWYVGVA